ncbi:hypothetical protein OS965_39510 [Streptomyces sp. H27-G5]|uniref:hypothetical protein n=1 Tax=Streptomyces sp. H27-G5 TaxID=2996698 RepID=UPI002271F7D1|nr:hypothetical protein [Streptomyces sp. H27-G5]MCY0924133.1 hypothetical protein [Streptomyces sp. H27-G5]
MFYVVDHTEKIGEPETLKKTAGCEGWIDALFYKGDCTMTVKIRYKAYLDVYQCTAPVLNPALFCSASEKIYLGQYATDELSQEVTHNITMAEYQAGVDPVDILFGSWIRCVQKVIPGGENGSWGGCAWASVDVALLFAGKILRPIADAAKAVDAAARTGIGFADAYKTLRNMGLSETAIAGITGKAVQKLREACTKGLMSTGGMAFRAAVKAGPAKCRDYANDYGTGGHGVLAYIDEEETLNLLVLAEKGVTPPGSEMIADAMAAIGGNAKGMRGTWLGGGSMKGNLDSFNAGIQSLRLSEEEAARRTFTGKMDSNYGFNGKFEIVKREGTPGNYVKVEVVFWR